MGTTPEPRGSSMRARACETRGVPTPPRVTRLAVLSDVHGNATALEAVLHELRLEPVDVVVFGGDLNLRMAEVPDGLYGQIGTSNYQGQELKLSKHFA